MNAQAILTKIEEDALETASKITDDAKAKAAELGEASREKIEGMHKAMLAQAARDSAELEQRIERMAELDARKTLLSKKRALIDAAFLMAADRLRATTVTEKRAFFLAQIVKNACGNETVIVGDADMAWFDDRFITDANAALKAAGKPGELTLSAKRLPGSTGLALDAGGAQLCCTLEALLEEARTRMEQQVAVELFGEQ